MSFARFLRDNAPFLAAGGLLTFSSSYGQTFFISVFAGEIRAEFGLSHGAWGAIYSAGTTASAIVMIWLGALTDTFRARVLGSVTLLGLAAACLMMAGVSAAWVLVPVIFLLRLTGQGMCGHIAQVAMARWFVGARGRALSIASMGVALGEALLPLIFVALLTVLPWRGLWMIAALMALIALPITLRLLRLERTPQSVAEDGQSLGMQQRHWRRPEMLRHWLFWAMVPSLLGPAAFSTAFFFQQVHTAEVKGWAHMELVALFPVFTVTSVVAMIGSGWVIDRVGTGRLIGIYQLPMAAGFAVIGLTDSLGAAALGMALMALSQGANSTLPAAFWAEFYGTRHLGAIKAMAVAVMVFGTAIGPGLTGWLIDRGLEFPDQMIFISAWFCAVAVLVSLAIARARRSLAEAAEIDVIRA